MSDDMNLTEAQMGPNAVEIRQLLGLKKGDEIPGCVIDLYSKCKRRFDRVMSGRGLSIDALAVLICVAESGADGYQMSAVDEEPEVVEEEVQRPAPPMPPPAPKGRPAGAAPGSGRK